MAKSSSIIIISETVLVRLFDSYQIILRLHCPASSTLNIQMHQGAFYGQKISFEKLCYHSLMSNVEINACIKAARELLDTEKNLSPAFRAAMSVMFMAVPFC